MMTSLACDASRFLSDCTGSPCVNGSCVCDAGFTGPYCNKLKVGDAVRAVELKDTWLWGSAAIQDPVTKTYHSFTMAQKNKCGIWHYRHNSVIYHSTSTSVLGPYQYQGIALDNRSEGFFDAVEVEDPSVIALPNGTGYLLFYTGAAYPFPAPPGKHIGRLNCSAHDVEPEPDRDLLAAGQRIGVAFAKSLSSTPIKWERPSGLPILTTRPTKWDSIRVCNPAPLIFPNGTALLAYRGVGPHHAGIGIAKAPHWSGPYEPLLDAPLFNGYAEDPFLFLSPTGVIHLIAHGGGKMPNATSVGIHAASLDGINWGSPRDCYDYYCDWAKGVPPASLGRRETPELLLDTTNGQPLALFNSAAPCKCNYFDKRQECLWGEQCETFSMAVEVLR